MKNVFYQVVFTVIFKFTATKLSEAVILKQPLSVMRCKSGTLEGPSPETVARNGNCQIFQLDFQLVSITYTEFSGYRSGYIFGISSVIISPQYNKKVIVNNY
jgi:hypothetical protein